MVTFRAMSSLHRYATVLRINLLLTFAEGAWFLWNFLKSSSETDSVVFLQYSLSRLFLLLFVLALMAGLLLTLVKIFQPDWSQQSVGKWLQSALDRTETFWALLICGGVTVVLAFTSDWMPGNLVLYREQILPMLIWFGISSMHWLLGWVYLQWTSSRILQSHAATVLPAGLFIVFILSREIYDRVGFTFQIDGINDYWQMIDPLLLQTDLWRSLLHLHSQPPMLNLFTGLVLQFFPTGNESVFHACYYLAGLLLTWSVYRIGLALEFPTWLSLTASMLFMISPAVVLYEHWLFYTYPVAAALALAGVALHRFHHTQKFGWGLFFFSLLAFIALSWSLFHLLWLIAIVSMLLFILPNRKKIFLAALLPLALVTGWYAKNYILFGEFTASTWAGMNLSHPTTLRLLDEELQRMVKTGELSPFAQYESFSNPEDYLTLLPDTPETGIPLLDMTKKSIGRVNFHHLVYVETTNYYRRDALRVIRAHPALYLRSIAQSLYIFFHSASDYDFLDYNRQRIPDFEMGWNRLILGQWQMNETLEERTEDMSIRHVGWWILIAFLTALFGAASYLWKSRRALNDEKNLLVLFMWFNLLYLALAGNLIDLGENNRFRFIVDPFILMLFLFVVVSGVHPKHAMIKPALEIIRRLARLFQIERST